MGSGEIRRKRLQTVSRYNLRENTGGLQIFVTNALVITEVP